MRCVADITAGALRIRDRESPTDPRCQREAVTRGLCRQHADMRECAYAACADHALTQVDGRWFCREHARMWRTHKRIVERILEIPART